MDSSMCNVIYVDRNVRDDRLLCPPAKASDSAVAFDESGSLRENLELLTDAFGDVHVCATGSACLSKLFDLHEESDFDSKPTIVLIDTPPNEPSEQSSAPRDASPHARFSHALDSADGEMYGMRLLEKIVYEAHSRNLSKMVIPIPIITFPLLQSSLQHDASAEHSTKPYMNYLSEPSDPSHQLMTNRELLRKCLDCGAVDVLASPLHGKSLTTLEVHAYRAHKEIAKEKEAMLEIRRGRKRSWVGVHEEKPFSYLREAMVSSLMTGICRSGGSMDEDKTISVKLGVSLGRQEKIAQAIGTWHFNAHDFCEDSLVVAGSMMFQHAFTMHELEKWRIPTDQLTAFLVACRAAYNTFVPYHNFRHAVDVLQATFNFLIHVGALPPYPTGNGICVSHKSPISALLKPFEALTLLISAIGHDVGHPGVNNGFLITLNAPLAQLYNDRSVLESFHCAAYSQILRRHWPSVFDETKMRNLMISTILATDMGLHNDYMKQLKATEDKLQANGFNTNAWDGREMETQKALACALLIKCADISNVARRHDAALKWMYILCDEFSRQASMEGDLCIPSALIAPPKKDLLSLAKAQLGFMNIFAIPLFEHVAEILPGMDYTVDEIRINKALFERTVAKETAEEVRRMKQREATLVENATTAMVTPLEMKDNSSKETLEAPNQPVAPPSSADEWQMKKSASASPERAAQVPDVGRDFKEANGEVENSDPVADFAASDPFNTHEHQSRVGHPKNRHSETTEGSRSAPCSGDWQSQATSATTGKMPLSPSTKGTSIISSDSMDGPSSVHVATLWPPKGQNGVKHSGGQPDDIPEVHIINSGEYPPQGDEYSGTHQNLKAERSLRKKTSRFRMNAMAFFRRNKSSSPSPSSVGGSEHTGG